MAWTNVNMTYATPHATNAWASLPGQGWRKIEERSTDGVTNVLVLLALARANDRQANVGTNSDNKITVAYL